MEGRLGYGVSWYGSTAKPDPAFECVEIIGDDEISKFGPTLEATFPNYGIEFYGPMPCRPEPIMFIHEDKREMIDTYGGYNYKTRIAKVSYKNNKTDRFFVREDVYKRIWK